MGIIDKIVTGAKNTGNKISEEADVHGLKSKISDEKKLIEITYREIGSYYYANRKNWKKDDRKKIDEYCIMIDASLLKIAEYEKEIEETKEKARMIREANKMESRFSRTFPPAVRRHQPCP